MAIRPFLAMTAGEFRDNPGFSGPIGWMSCLFSPYGTGLSNLPPQLPEGSLLILSDCTPLRRQETSVITRQLCDCITGQNCAGLLLDFQQPEDAKLGALAEHLSKALPCPVAVSECYAHDLDCAVFLPPVPPGTPIAEYLAPWQGREIWLELALDGEIITLTETGAAVTPLPHGQPLGAGFAEERLHCHYRIETMEAAVRFTLWRTREDLEALLQEAEAFGVTTAVGLYQELHTPSVEERPV